MWIKIVYKKSPFKGAGLSPWSKGNETLRCNSIEKAKHILAVRNFVEEAVYYGKNGEKTYLVRKEPLRVGGLTISQDVNK